MIFEDSIVDLKRKKNGNSHYFGMQRFTKNTHLGASIGIPASHHSSGVWGFSVAKGVFLELSRA